MELTEPSGWVYIPVESPSGRPLRANMIQFAVITNHQNGRDTHLRLLEVYSPLAYVDLGALILCLATRVESVIHDPYRTE